MGKCEACGKDSVTLRARDGVGRKRVLVPLLTVVEAQGLIAERLATWRRQNAAQSPAWILVGYGAWVQLEHALRCLDGVLGLSPDRGRLEIAGAEVVLDPQMAPFDIRFLPSSSRALLGVAEECGT